MRREPRTPGASRAQAGRAPRRGVGALAPPRPLDHTRARPLSPRTARRMRRRGASAPTPARAAGRLRRHAAASGLACERFKCVRGRAVAAGGLAGGRGKEGDEARRPPFRLASRARRPHGPTQPPPSQRRTRARSRRSPSGARRRAPRQRSLGRAHGVRARRSATRQARRGVAPRAARAAVPGTRRRRQRRGSPARRPGRAAAAPAGMSARACNRRSASQAGGISLESGISAPRSAAPGDICPPGVALQRAHRSTFSSRTATRSRRRAKSPSGATSIG
jgi:hypothetical protein